MRLVWASCGILALGIGIIGAFLPLLPTVPLVLLAAFCFARSSERLHDWLLSHRSFGPMISDWRLHGAIAPHAKRLATLSIAAVFLISILSRVPAHVIWIQIVVLGLVLIFIWTRPNGSR